MHVSTARRWSYLVRIFVDGAMHMVDEQTFSWSLSSDRSQRWRAARRCPRATTGWGSR